MLWPARTERRRQDDVDRDSRRSARRRTPATSRFSASGWADSADWLRTRLGIQLQETQLADKLTVEETLRLFRSFYPDGPTVDELLATVELESKRRSWVVKLSGGQKQRLSVACAMAGRPELLFLDEPTTGLDPQSRRQLWGVLERFRETGGTILITTHYMDEAHALCDRVGIMDQGKLIALGTPASLVASLGAEHVIQFARRRRRRRCRPTMLLRALPGVSDVRHENGSVSLATSEVHRAVPALLDALNRAPGVAQPADHTQRDARRRVRVADRPALARFVRTCRWPRRSPSITR